VFSASDTWTALQRVRKARPLVHSIVNHVTMNTVANGLLALGASPVMARTAEEVADVVAIAAALVVNIGTPSPASAAAMKIAADRAAALGVPWVLDPVGAGAVAFRTDLALDLCRRSPTAIRGNGSEIMALAGGNVTREKGVDSAHGADEALAAARALAARCGAVVAVTGAVDHVTDGTRVVSIRNGDPMMARVTGVGCVGSALAAAFLAAGGLAPLDAVAAALLVLGVAGEAAAEDSPGPGTLNWRLMDALYCLDGDMLAARTRIG
jgi:hydroxyethylthiazole kinase